MKVRKISYHNALNVLNNGGFITFLGGVYTNEGEHIGYTNSGMRNNPILYKTSDRKWMIKKYHEIHQQKLQLARLIGGDLAQQKDPYRR